MCFSAPSKLSDCHKKAKAWNLWWAEWNTRLKGTYTSICRCRVGTDWPNTLRNTLRNILQVWVIAQYHPKRHAVFQTVAAVRGKKQNTVMCIPKARACVNSVFHRRHMLFPDVMPYPGKEITWQILSPKLSMEGPFSGLAVWRSGRKKCFQNLGMFAAGEMVLTSCPSRRGH